MTLRYSKHGLCKLVFPVSSLVVLTFMFSLQEKKSIALKSNSNKCKITKFMISSATIRPKYNKAANKNLVGEDLAGGMQDVVTLRSDAVDVVDDPRKLAAFVRTFFLFHKLFESVLGELLVLYVVRLVLFCTEMKVDC